MHRVPERLCIETNAKRLAHCAVRPIAPDQVLGLNVLRPASFEIDNLRAHATGGLLKGFEAAAVAQAHMRKRASEALKDRVEPHLRADLQPHRAVGLRPRIFARRPRHAAKLVARKACHKRNVERVIRRKRTGMHRVCDAPAPAELHGANVYFIHLRGDDPAVTLFDERTGNSAPAEFARERQADRSATDDQNGSCLHARPPIRTAAEAKVGRAALDHSALMAANFTTLAHFSVSAVMNLLKSEGDPTNDKDPNSANRAFILGSAIPALISLLSLSTISEGVPFGAPMPNQPLASKPGIKSFTAGTSGRTSERAALVIARGRSRPALTWAIETGRAPK